jgi:hypothetical protein
MAGSRKGKWVKRSEGEWGALLSGFARSGLSVEAFCQREAISVASFYRWRGLLAQLPQFGVRDADFVLLLRGGDTVFSFCSA